ncbi:MAG: hypothetical protein IJ071_08595 [Ruminococcus sp.]|nr:hypothetical protein [Ruminococcus sp.]
MKERLTKLLSVKSIVTLLLSGAFVWLSVCGELDAQQFLTVYTVVISFYFGTQSGRMGDNTNG